MTRIAQVRPVSKTKNVSVLILTLSPAYSVILVQFILIVAITCSTGLDDSPDIHTTCLVCCVVVCFSSLVQPACLLEHGAHGKRSGRYLLFCGSLSTRVDRISVNLSDRMNDVGSILFSAIQTELIEKISSL